VKYSYSTKNLREQKQQQQQQSRLEIECIDCRLLQATSGLRPSRSQPGCCPGSVSDTRLEICDEGFQRLIASAKLTIMGAENTLIKLKHVRH
jgi:hypothetical protein